MCIKNSVFEEMIISLIAILTINHVIGRENCIPWFFHADMFWFKYHTLGKPVIMGRKTFESIKKKPLLGRLNIILSNQLVLGQRENNVYVVSTPEQALSLVQKSNEVMIIGGSTIYNIFLPRCKRMYLTYINCIYNYGDSWFPNYNKNEWKVVFNFYKLCKVHSQCYFDLCFEILERY